MQTLLIRRFLFWAAVFFLFFYLLGQIPLWSSDEGRFGEIAREMWVSKDFIVPHFNGIEHLEKPVFAFWLAALSLGIFGEGSFAARLPGALSALAGIILTYHFTKRWFNQRTAEMAALILATSGGYVLVGRFAMIDMTMTMLLTGAFFCLGHACLNKTPRFYLAAYFFMGLALLCKGLIGVALPGLAFLGFLAWTADWRELQTMRLGWGILILGLIFIPWAYAVSLRHPEFPYVFIIQQQFTRFSSGFFGRARPFWFFVPVLFLSAFPWSLFLPWAFLKVRKTESTQEKKVMQFLICWAGAVFLFFSLPKSKLPYYLLPLTPPVSVLVASWFDTMKSQGGRSGELFPFFRNTLRLVGALSVAALIGINLYVIFWAHEAMALTLKSLVLWPLVFVLMGIGVAAYFSKKGNTDRVILTIAVTVYAVLLGVITGMSRLTPYFSTFDDASTLIRVAGPSSEVAVYGSPDRFSDLPFHLRRRVMVVGSDHGTLSTALAKPEHAGDVTEWFPSAGQFVERFNAGQDRLFCLMVDKNLQELTHIGLKNYRVIRQDSGKLLITNDVKQ